MQVDQPLTPSPFCNPNDFNSEMSDFLNMDLFSASSFPSSNHSSSSRASSRSPPPSDALATPPQPFLPAVVDANSFASDFFNFSAFDDDYTKADPLVVPPVNISDTPFDFFGVLSGRGPANASTSSSSDPSPPFSIDPHLMDTPATSQAASDFGGDDKHSPISPLQDHDQDQDEEDDEAMSPASIAPVKVGGKGKARKGTVQSGGIAKKTAVSSVVKVKEQDEDRDDFDDWRPSPEEYKKMSSKEKRQLRNKISARNFRVRRKEYINTLEGDIAERDRLIDAIRTELGSTKSENVALRQEISALKKALLNMDDAPILPPPGPIPSPSPAAAVPAASTPAPARASSSLLTPNVHKDLPSSPAMANKAFWGGSPMGFGGITPVHTTIIPESYARPLASGKPLAGRRSPMLQENINPSLNTGAQPTAFGGLGGQQPSKPGFDMFAENNPFTMKMLDAYRMQLWTRMAQQTRQHHQQQQQQQQQYRPSSPSPFVQPHAPITGLASNLRPHYFTAKASGSLSALLSGKHLPSTTISSSAASAYPTPPTSPKTSSASLPASNSTPKEAVNPQHALLAAMASQTLFQKLGSAFWDAFSGSSASPSTSARPGWDADKVRRVLEGKAVVRVVDVDEDRERTRVPAAAARLATPVSATARERECSIPACLEESMRALSLGKK